VLMFIGSCLEYNPFHTLCFPLILRKKRVSVHQDSCGLMAHNFSKSLITLTGVCTDKNQEY